MEEEVWKDIEGYENLYQVSSEGRVKSLEKDVVWGNGAVRHQEEKLLKYDITRDGYFRVGLCKNDKRKWNSVHRLVAQAFIPNPDNLPCINHKDETPSHNNVENLEWCTQKYNINYGTAIQRRSKKVYQYTLDGELVKVWASTKECGRNGFNHGAIAACCRGIKGYEQHKGFRWSYTPLEAPNA